jgi:hypothetical protein
VDLNLNGVKSQKKGKKSVRLVAQEAKKKKKGGFFTVNFATFIPPFETGD